MSYSSKSSAGNGLRPMPTLGLLPVLAISATIAGDAHAQTTDSEHLGTIVLHSGGAQGEAANDYRVTEGSSEKFTQPIVDTPKTITVITQRQMEERNATSVLEVLRTTPGVTLGSGEGGTPMGDRFFIRGYQAATDMMIDGVRNLGRTSSESFNVESVEVVKGPGGAYSGRGATGGSVNLVTKQAQLGESFNTASATVGNGKHKRLSYDGNFDLGQDMALRLNVMAQDSGVPGRDVLEDDRKGIALAFTKGLGASKVSLNLSHDEAHGTPDLGVPMETAGWRTRNGGPAISTDNPGRPIEVMPDSAFFGSAYRDFRDVTNQSAMLKFEHEFSETLKWDTTLAWIGSEQHYMMTRPTMRGNTDQVVRDLRSGAKKNRAVAFQTGLSGSFETGTLTHDFAVGLEYSKEKIGSASLIGTGPLVGSNPTPPTVGTTPVGSPNPFDPVQYPGYSWGAWGTPIETTTKALYLFDTIHFDPQWSLDLGLRYDKYKVEDDTRSRKDNMLNYSAALVYKPAQNGSVYFAIGTSSNPSGECAGMAGGADGAGACTLTAGSVNLDPEKSKSYELGTKWELFDSRLLVSAALFRTEKKNARVTDPITGVGVALAGESRAQGIELGVAGQINDQWGVSLGYAYTDAEVIKGGGTTGANDGKQMQFNAKNSFSLWSTYAVNDKLTLGGGATFTDKRWLDAANTMILPSQWRFDAMVAYELTEATVLQVNINNLLDERLYDASHVGIFANRAPGRSVTAKIDYRF
ncbi:TonB-dependent siderophore receptor [Rhodobacter sp. 24-YEA-8]|uniref:TonB-dependent receptor n=1 Tax=Rhodobacter sp. 24-YEA-8 TaxID=1884310 RepID=UPI00089BA536|nr:TonB-dependent siderophore receptor [Rhodobacter sp. 24-YEA-8]SED41097.1 catecholate siderophore receptor [Rhodobacter sp. 24-YEA-8]